LSDTGEGLESILKKDKEYISYESEIEAKRLISKYLEDSDEREEIAQAGYERVIRDHLLIDKLEMMFDEV
jgi:spore maturation protein CgeB